ncbi:MAG TPA: hypothetical protein VJ455_10490 [Ignavibacteria bacterium]|nr:hypothetical protein [Ignavibacteria bacterium]
MKIIPLIILIVLFFGCTKEQKTTQTTDAKKDSAVEKPKTEQTTKTNPKGAGDDTTKPQTSFSNVEYGISKLPPTLTGYQGKIVAMAKWEDKMGANVVFITETEEKESGDIMSKELFGYHYTITDKENKLIWKINDFVKDCPVDLTLKYIDKSISITDLNNNGTGESSFLYRMSCKGDVSPDDMKLIMHEGETKYAIRGEMKLNIKGEGTYGGKMNVDPSFDKAPKEFLENAKARWNKYKDEEVGY